MADVNEARTTFDRYDADGDGQVTPDEFKRAMAEMGDAYVTGPVAEAVIKAKDADSNGKMSFDEFWQALQG